MKPNFALNLSHEGISLLHRSTSGRSTSGRATGGAAGGKANGRATWSLVGEVKLDSAQLTSRLAELRRTATELEQAGLVTKLVIPNSQILYTDLPVSGSTDEERRAQVRAGLVGLTPYEVEDLVFDLHAIRDNLVQVAVVAKDTLKEAEAFAAEFKFNPVCFVGIAPKDAFGPEPYFGLADGAAAVLGAEVALERDAHPIVLADARRMPPPRPKVTIPSGPAAAPEPEKQVPSLQELTERAALGDSVSAAPGPVADEASPAAEEETATADMPPAEPEPTPKKKKTRIRKSKAKPSAAAKSKAKPTAKTKSKTAPAAAPADTPAPADVEETPEHVHSSAPLSAERPVEPLTEPEPSAVPRSEPASAAPRTPEPSPETRIEPEPKDALLTFATRREASRAPAFAEPPTPALDPPRLETSLIDTAPEDLADPMSDPAADVQPPPRPASGAAIRATVTDYSALDLDDIPDMPAWRQKDPASSPLRADPAPASAARIPVGRRSPGAGGPDQPSASALPFAPDPTLSARPQVGGKPRYLGLVLTVLLLMGFGVAALWSSLFSDAVDPAPTIAALPQSGTATVTPTAEPEPDGDQAVVTPAPIATPAPAPGPEPDALPPVTAGLSESLSVPPQPVAPTPPAEVDTASTLVAPSREVAIDPVVLAPPPDRVSERPPSRAEAERRYATTGIWQLDPQPLPQPADPSEIETVETAAIDGTLAPLSFSALPSTEPDLRPPSLLPPRRLLASFNLDDRGLVAATPEGNLSPDGTLVYLGTPPVIPGIRPGTVLPADPIPAPSVETEVSSLDATLPPTALPGPSPVPDSDADAAPVPDVDATPETTPETGTDTTPVAAAPPELTPEQEELRQFRPQPRPGGLSDETLNTETDGDVPVTVAPSELALIRPTLRPPSIQEEVDADEGPSVGENASELAVTASFVPGGRPSAVLQRAAAAARAAEEERRQPEPVISTEVEVAAAVVPSAPARASVARAATERNAIQLGKVNLLGVYGSPSDRRALVRLKNGRYVKVEVGDRVDGGRVAAIGDNQLRYIKSGRNITLTIPNG